MASHSAPPAAATATDLHCQAHRCTNDLIALGVLQELTGRGLRVPDDVAIVGYDDIEFAGRRPRNAVPLDQPAPRLPMPPRPHQHPTAHQPPAQDPLGGGGEVPRGQPRAAELRVPASWPTSASRNRGSSDWGYP
ncbi:substrate-binding domain-containing protein [Micromonospora purpureochromogenes]|uniref:substrate-binding domain-containing protein n=1 Tax=Micromonospora purpureochromogenes TaxID=47872 RepID=UPI003F4D4C5C